MSLEHLWAGWRMPYIAGGPPAGEPAAPGGDEDPGGGCVFCAILASGEPDERTYVVWRGELCFAVLNAYPYTSGHLMVLPKRHASSLGELTDAESAEMWYAMTAAATALSSAYSPEGLNVGANLGRAAGAGIPAHLHFHVVPRWAGDTNFMTSVADTRVLPEALADTWSRVAGAWPS